MADLLLVHFALVPGPVGKERQFSLPGDFSGLDFQLLFPHGRAISRPVLPRFFEFLQHGQNVLHDDERARNFNISALRCKRRRLLAAVI